jgi:hypothetical protein
MVNASRGGLLDLYAKHPSLTRARSLSRTRYQVPEEAVVSGDISSDRAARNQSLYRSANEQLKPINEAAEQLGDPVSEWICECADTACTLHVYATLSEYECVRSNPRAFIVYQGHIYPAVEAVVAENDRYTTVEKRENGGRVAEALDPRGRDSAA